MPIVAVLNDESDQGEILGALKAYGLVLANCYTRPGAADLTKELRAALGSRSDENQLVCHNLPLAIEGDPSWTSVLVLPPRYTFHYRETMALAARALSAADESDKKGMFLYHEP
ncbi:hypothetical protein A7J50_3394 [Pseudomonas antarctica]|uniref:Uncharacterized protein n=1 Tax=Pseudomonas antarctica TaxID=219572 RepID=A0A172Z347_9PSED|nr:hypothetical protein [Pseudomonas antarctica]ANF86772.1 hypothetical protein A7J50_3394 [Pseudomonas antarctica]